MSQSGTAFRWWTQVFKIEGFVCKRFHPSPPPPPSFTFWLLFHFSHGQNRKSPSSVFLCSETKRKCLLCRLCPPFQTITKQKHAVSPGLAVMFHAVDDTYIRPSCEATFSCGYLCIQLSKAVENLNKFFGLIHLFRGGGSRPSGPPPEASLQSSEIACCMNSIGHNVVAICAALFCYQEPKTSCLLYMYVTVTTKWLICYCHLGTSIYYFHFCHLKAWQHRWFELIFGDSNTQSTMSLKKCYLQVKLSIYHTCQPPEI